MAPLFPLHPKKGSLPALNSACPWASTYEHLEQLYASPYTRAVTTRTATLQGFPTDGQVAFYGHEGRSTINCYGYSPHPLSTYLGWLRQLLGRTDVPRKLVIVSIASTELDETREMLEMLQRFSNEVDVHLAVEYNASCPNIAGHPPPAYDSAVLERFVQLLAAHASKSLSVGIKLPPYTYMNQFESVISALRSVSPPKRGQDHPISFLTATNTLGQGLVYGDQVVTVEGAEGTQIRTTLDGEEERVAVSAGWGGLAGDAVHELSLGNVARLRTMLDTSTDSSLRTISLIGVGGVSDEASAERFRRAGASAVACASALGRHGVSVFQRIHGGTQSRL